MVNMVWCENRVSKLNIFQQSHFDGQFFALKYETNTMKAMCEEIRPGTRGSRQIKLGSILNFRLFLRPFFGWCLEDSMISSVLRNQFFWKIGPFHTIFMARPTAHEDSCDSCGGIRIFRSADHFFSPMAPKPVLWIASPSLHVLPAITKLHQVKAHDKRIQRKIWEFNWLNSWFRGGPDRWPDSEVFFWKWQLFWIAFELSLCTSALQLGLAWTGSRFYRKYCEQFYHDGPSESLE